jgi:hypothetical protein
MEDCKIIAEYPNYAITRTGDVINVKTKRVMKPDLGYKNMEGISYRRVTLSKYSTTARFWVHRLVAEAFIANPDSKPYINHIDNNPSNNHVKNLEWCTRSENMIHCKNTGRATYTTAAAKGVAAKRTNKEAILRNKLGTQFVSFNLAKTSTVSFTCYSCEAVTTVRLDSTALTKEHTCCKKCSYKLR